MLLQYKMVSLFGFNLEAFISPKASTFSTSLHKWLDRTWQLSYLIAKFSVLFELLLKNEWKLWVIQFSIIPVDPILNCVLIRSYLKYLVFVEGLVWFSERNLYPKNVVLKNSTTTSFPYQTHLESCFLKKR